MGHDSPTWRASSHGQNERCRVQSAQSRRAELAAQGCAATSKPRLSRVASQAARPIKETRLSLAVWHNECDSAGRLIQVGLNPGALTGVNVRPRVFPFPKFRKVLP